MTIEKTMNDLITFYYEMKRIINHNQNIILCKEENITTDENKIKKIESYVNKDLKECVLKISVFEKGYIKINFYEESKFFYECYKSKEKPVNDLILIYFEKKGYKYDNSKIFLCKEENIAIEGNKNKKIKDFIDPALNVYSLNISIFQKGIIKVKYYEKSVLLFEAYISSKKKVNDLFHIYYEKRGITNENKKYFLCNSEAILFEEHKNNNIIEYIKKGINNHSLSIAVYNLGESTRISE